MCERVSVGICILMALKQYLQPGPLSELQTPICSYPWMHPHGCSKAAHMQHVQNLTRRPPLLHLASHSISFHGNSILPIAQAPKSYVHPFSVILGCPCLPAKYLPSWTTSQHLPGSKQILSFAWIIQITSQPISQL